MTYWISIFSLVILCCGCTKSKGDEYAKEGEAIARDITQMLATVENKEDMQRVARKVKKRVEKLTTLMVDAKKQQLKGGAVQPDAISMEVSRELRDQLGRILAIEGVENILHDSMRDQMRRLDAFDRQIEKKYH